jgi:hypothetical protein
MSEPWYEFIIRGWQEKQSRQKLTEGEEKLYAYYLSKRNK